MDSCSRTAASGDGRTTFKTTPNGQLKMPRLGNYCVTLVGDSPSSADVARDAETAATSSNSEHAVKNIADSDAQSFWASENDPTAPVDVQLDFGAAQKISRVQIDWEHPAQDWVALCLHGFVVAISIHTTGFRDSSCQWWQVDKRIHYFWQ